MTLACRLGIDSTIYKPFQVIYSLRKALLLNVGILLLSFLCKAVKSNPQTIACLRFSSRHMAEVKASSCGSRERVE